MELLHFIFSSFWYFVGSIVLISVVLNGIAAIVRAFR